MTGESMIKEVDNQRLIDLLEFFPQPCNFTSKSFGLYHQVTPAERFHPF
jgi:hypothetical protein